MCPLPFVRLHRRIAVAGNTAHRDNRPSTLAHHMRAPYPPALWTICLSGRETDHSRLRELKLVSPRFPVSLSCSEPPTNPRDDPQHPCPDQQEACLSPTEPHREQIARYPRGHTRSLTMHHRLCQTESTCDVGLRVRCSEAARRHRRSARAVRGSHRCRCRCMLAPATTKPCRRHRRNRFLRSRTDTRFPGQTPANQASVLAPSQAELRRCRPSRPPTSRSSANLCRRCSRRPMIFRCRRTSQTHLMRRAPISPRRRRTQSRLRLLRLLPCYHRPLSQRTRFLVCRPTAHQVRLFVRDWVFYSFLTFRIFCKHMPMLCVGFNSTIRTLSRGLCAVADRYARAVPNESDFTVWEKRTWSSECFV